MSSLIKDTNQETFSKRGETFESFFSTQPKRKILVEFCQLRADGEKPNLLSMVLREMRFTFDQKSLYVHLYQKMKDLSIVIHDSVKLMEVTGFSLEKLDSCCVELEKDNLITIYRLPDTKHFLLMVNGVLKEMPV